MEDKKSAVLTIRLKEITKKKLEEEAEDRGWSPSKLAERILVEYTEKEKVYERKKEEENKAKEMLEFITKTKCDKVTNLIKWAIENDAMETYNLSASIWTEAIKEIKLDNTEK